MTTPRPRIDDDLAGAAERIWRLVNLELARARAKHPLPRHTMTAATEELGELARAVLHNVSPGETDPYAGRPEDVIKEGVQTISMIVRLLTEGDESLELDPLVRPEADADLGELVVPVDLMNLTGYDQIATPPWLLAALEELGVRERPGDAHERRIIQYHGTTSLAAVEDEVPWCSSFACWCLEQVGLPHPRSAASRSWLDWGEVLQRGRLGCIVVLARSREVVPWRVGGEPAGPHGGQWIPGHVGFYLDKVGDRVQVLGGNQANRVSIRRYPASRVVGYRWPSAEVRR